jgi:exodeoxyribonuclease VII small subunit
VSRRGGAAQAAHYISAGNLRPLLYWRFFCGKPVSAPESSLGAASAGNRYRPDPIMVENTNTDVKRLTFERAIEELESIVKRLEEGKVPLEESVAIYERGEALKRRCEDLLRQAEARVEKITLDAAGKPAGTEPLDVG